MDPRVAAIHPSKFWDRVVAGGEGCWLWDGNISGSGYGYLSQRVGAEGRPASVYAHRMAYEMFVGEVPAGLEVDHLCRVRSCVRPDHLEPVTHAENVRRSVEARRVAS